MSYAFCQQGFRAGQPGRGRKPETRLRTSTLPSGRVVSRRRQEKPDGIREARAEHPGSNRRREKATSRKRREPDWR